MHPPFNEARNRESGAAMAYLRSGRVRRGCGGVRRSEPVQPRGALVRGAGKALLLAFCLLQPLAVAAHGDPDERITALTERIAFDPNNARLFLARGKLLRLADHDEAALRDFERAARRDPALREAD